MSRLLLASCAPIVIGYFWMLSNASLKLISDGQWFVNLRMVCVNLLMMRGAPGTLDTPPNTFRQLMLRNVIGLLIS